VQASLLLRIVLFAARLTDKISVAAIVDYDDGDGDDDYNDDDEDQIIMP
jgi:hypothetical protein